jgi:hypothetical protein
MECNYVHINRKFPRAIQVESSEIRYNYPRHSMRNELSVMTDTGADTSKETTVYAL